MSGYYNNTPPPFCQSSPINDFGRRFATPSPPNQFTRFSSPKYRSPSQYHYQQHPYNRSPNSPSNWSTRAEKSFDSPNGYRSFNSNLSYGSSSSPRSFNTPGSYYKNKGRFSNNNSFASDNSNPGHIADIQQYAHPTMLEDPWKNLMGNLQKDKKTPKDQEQSS